MFLLTGNHPDMARLQIRAIDAAASAGVEHVVKLSALGASDHAKLPIGRAYHEAQAATMASRMRWTILPPHVFMQNQLAQAPGIVHEGADRGRVRQWQDSVHRHARHRGVRGRRADAGGATTGRSASSQDPRRCRITTPRAF